MLKPRKIPLRKCLGCQEMKDKRELLRVVRSNDGAFAFDATGRQNGRGAYICPNSACFEKAFRRKGLERSFGRPVPVDIYERLKVELQSRVQYREST